MTDTVDDRIADEMVRSCRATIGDNLRSVTYFTHGDFDQLYLRSDLDQDVDLAGFVDYESLGFGARAAYHGSELGEYRYTIRVFDNGYLLRVTRGDVGVFITTDSLTLQNFAEVATAIEAVLEEATP